MRKFLLGLVILSLFLRFFQISLSPPELFGDEVDVGYLSFSLLKTGRDLYLQPFPIYINSLSEDRLPVLIYSTVPSVFLFGLSALSVRLPEIIFGSLAPVIIFLLVFQISRRRSLAAFTAVFLALTPWHIHYSRAAFEVVIMLDLIMLGVLLYLRKKPILSALFLCLSFYTYSTAIVFVPLLIIGIFAYQKKLPSFRFSVFSILFLTPFLYFLFSGTAGTRFQLLSIFNNPDVIRNSINLRNSAAGPYEFIFHNHYQAIGEYFLQNYLRAFSTDFLFVRGDPTIRSSFIISGQLLPIVAPLVLIGLAVLIFEKQYFWLYWLAISPIPSALTYDGGYHATRLFFMLVPLSIATASGYWYLLRNSKMFWHFIAFTLILANFIYLAHYYIVHYPQVSWRWWQVGYQEIFSDLKNISPQYSKVFINNTYEPSLIRFLFYTQYDPHLFQKQFTLDQTIPNIEPYYDGFRLGDKYVFGTFSNTVNKYNLGSFVETNALYLISARDEIPAGVDWNKDKPAGIEILSEINSPENTHLFYLIRKSP